MDNRSNGSGKQKKDQENTSWTKDPSLAGMDPDNLAMLNSIALQGEGIYPQDFCPAGRGKKSSGTSSPSYGSSLPEPGKGYPLFQGRDGRYHPGPESRKIPGRNRPYG